VMRWEPSGFPGIWGETTATNGDFFGKFTKSKTAQVFWDHVHVFNQETHNMHQGIPATKVLAKWILAV